MSEAQEARPLPALAVDFIEHVVGQMNCRRGLREEVRRELAAHFEDGLQHCATEEARTAAARELVDEFGDGALLAELLQRGKRRCEPGRVSASAGIMIVAVLILVAMSLGGPLGVFVNIPNIVLVAGIPFGICTVTYGLRPVDVAFRCALCMVLPMEQPEISSSTLLVLRSLVRASYAASAIGVQIGLIQVFFFLADPSQIGPAVCVLLLMPFYGVLLAEGVFRPAAARSAFLCALVRPELTASNTTNSGDRNKL